MDIPTLKKMLTENLAKDFASTSTLRNKLDIRVYFLINVIDIAMTLAILKARLSPKSIPKFDEKYKKMQMKARTELKKFGKKKKYKKAGKISRLLKQKKGG